MARTTGSPDGVPNWHTTATRTDRQRPVFASVKTAPCVSAFSHANPLASHQQDNEISGLVVGTLSPSASYTVKLLAGDWIVESGTGDGLVAGDRRWYPKDVAGPVVDSVASVSLPTAAGATVITVVSRDTRSGGDRATVHLYTIRTMGEDD